MTTRRSRSRAAGWPGSATGSGPVHAVYDDIDSVLDDLGVSGADGILFDLGVSSLQLDEAERGFAYRVDAPLDMRMDQSSGLTAADVLNTYDTPELSRVLKDYGEERFARKIAGAVVRQREEAPFSTSGPLVDLLRRVIPMASQRQSGHPAKRTFQGAAHRGQRRAGRLASGHRRGHRRAVGGRSRRGAVLPLPRGPGDEARHWPPEPRRAPPPAFRSSCPSTRRTSLCSPAAVRRPPTPRSPRTPGPLPRICAPPSASGPADLPTATTATTATEHRGIERTVPPVPPVPPEPPEPPARREGTDEPDDVHGPSAARPQTRTQCDAAAGHA